MYIQQVQQQYSKVQHSTAHSPRVDVLCMQYSKYSRYSRYSSTAQYSKVDVPPELWAASRAHIYWALCTLSARNDVLE